MKFCEDCGSRMTTSQCNTCGTILEEKYESGLSKTVIKTEEKDQQIDIREDDDTKTMPTIEIECPKCKNDKAVWWLLQTRSGDEPATQFFRCTKCSQTWREYS